MILEASGQRKIPFLDLYESLIEGGTSQQSMQLSTRWGAASTDSDWLENQVCRKSLGDLFGVWVFENVCTLNM